MFVTSSSRVHQVRNSPFIVPIRLKQSANYLFAAFRRMVLVQLPFAFEPIDVNFKSHNCGKKLFDEVCIGRVHRPRLLPIRFVAAHRPLQNVVQAVTVVDQPQRAVCVNRDVVPCRNDVLGLDPAGRDVSVRPVIDYQYSLIDCQLPVRIRSRHVPDQPAMRPDIAVEQ